MNFCKALKNFGALSTGAFVFSTLLISIAVAAQSKTETDSTQYKVTSWGTDQGLPNTLINVFVDKSGFLWIASYDGLFRFDGNKFDTYNKFNTSTLKSNRVSSFAQDANGNLWIGTGLGLVVYKNGQIANVSDEFDHYVESLCLDERHHRLWIGTRDAGLFSFDIASNRFKKIEQFPSDLINAIACDSVEGIWVGSDKNGLVYIKDQIIKRFDKADGLTNTEVLHLFTDEEGRLYVSTTLGLFQKQGSKFISYREFESLRVSNVKKDSKGRLWVATTFGVRRQNSDGTWNQVTAREGLSNNDVQDLCFDEEGNIWLATYRGGLNQLRASKFSSISANQGLVTEGVGAIHEVSKNKFLIGTTDGKLFSITNGSIKQILFKTKFIERVYDILCDEKNNVWVASYNGLLLLTPDGKEKLFTEIDGLPTRQLRIIYQDHAHNYWIGTRNKGLIKMELKDSPFKPHFNLFKYDELNRAHSTFIMSMEEDANGNFLIGSDTGGLLIIKSDGTVIHYGKEEGNTSAGTLSAHFDKDGIIWMATSEGISRMAEGTFFNYDRDDGLSAGNVFDIVEDNQGYLWLSSAKEIIRVQKQQLADYRNKKINRIDWKVYNNNNELRNSYCTAPSHMTKASDGKIWFPMKEGVVVADTRSLTTNFKEPPVHIEKITIDDSELDGNQNVFIPAGNHRTVFNYTALCLSYPNSVKYKYKLEPFDKDWNDAGNDRQAVYTGLPGGEYVFKVIACNNDGIWNNTGATLAVTKGLYFYQTWWFYSIVFIALVFGMIMYVRWDTKETKAKALLLEREVERRTRQLKQKSEALEEQNREKTGMINIVAHDLKAPLNKIKGLISLMKMTGAFSAEQQEYVNYIDRSIHQGDELIRDLLDIHSFEHEDSKLEMEEINLVKTMNEWQQAVTAQLHQKSQALKSRIEIDEHVMITSDRQKLIRILDNLLTNASKFSESGKNIYFKVWQNAEVMSFSIRDEGPGISEEDQKKMFKRFQKLSARPTAGESSSGLGLSIIKVLLSKLGGSIQVQSKLGEGTEFVVSLPLQQPQQA